MPLGLPAIPLELGFGEVLLQPTEAFTHVYFPIDSFISLIVVIDTASGWKSRWLLMTQDRAGTDQLHLNRGTPASAITMIARYTPKCYR